MGKNIETSILCDRDHYKDVEANVIELRRELMVWEKLRQIYKCLRS